MTTQTDLPSGCLDALQRGFNLPRGDFLGNPVFAYNPNGSVTLKGATYTAEEDGFLHGGISITQEGPRPRLFAYVAQSASALGQMVAAIDANPPIACTAAHLWTSSDRICPQGAIFLPVPRGMSYQAVLDRWGAGVPGVNVALNWTPLTAV